MSLEAVVEDIRDEARARAEEIRADAERRADAIIEDAERDAAEIKEQRQRDVESTIEQERERRLSSANLEAKQSRLETKQSVLSEVHDAVKASIADLEDGREELTRALLDDAATEFDDDERVRVYGRADDEALLKELLTDFEGFEYAGQRDCLGGVIVEGEAGRVRITNTFDSILETVWEQEVRTVSQQLFEE